ncbi:MAG: tetratricopeptide repeat protein [Fimbriimonadales bacterium]|nr:tetratricopeptide repeat protein [Fimbriimonadales bacterium]
MQHNDSKNSRRKDPRQFNGIVSKVKRHLQQYAPRTPYYGGACLGREQELATVRRWYEHPNAPLLTLVGPSGIGKTHLACEFARQARQAGEPCIYINLTLIQEPSQILSEVFHALNLPVPDEETRPLLLRRIFNKRTLLVLDDFDLLLPEGANAVRALLDAAPALKILATSQLPLKVPQEQLLELAPLPVPPEGLKPRSIQELMAYPSVAVFVSQIGALPEELRKNPAQAAQLCRDLGGHPGDLVLAGLYAQECRWLDFYRQYPAWFGLQGSTNKPFAQQRRLFQRLRAEEQRMARCLLIFPDTFEAEVAAAAAQTDTETMARFLQSLLSRQWLQVVQESSTPRYRLKPNVRSVIPPLVGEHYAIVAERLHLFYVDWLQRAFTQGYASSAARQWCFEERYTLEKVLEELAQCNRSQAIAQLLHLITELCVARPPARLLDWGVAYVTVAQWLAREERITIAQPLLTGLIHSGMNERAHAIAAFLENENAAAFEVGRYWHNIAHGDRARHGYLTALRRAEMAHDREKAVWAAASLAESEAVIGNLQDAEHWLHYTETRYTLSRLNPVVHSWFYYVSGYTQYQRGRFRRARELYKVALQSDSIRSDILRELSRVELEMGNYALARQHALEALALLDDEIEPLSPSIQALRGCLGDVCAVEGDYSQALEYHLTGLRFWQERGQPRWLCWTMNRLAEIELLARDADYPWRLQPHLGMPVQELLREAWRVIEPTYMNLPHKSRALHNLGWLAWHEGRVAEAESYLQQALQIRQGYGNEYGVARTQELLARVRFSQRRYREAAERFEHAREIRSLLRVRQYPAVKHCSLSIQKRLQRHIG